jgi:hypothetical protein
MTVNMICRAYQNRIAKVKNSTELETLYKFEETRLRAKYHGSKLRVMLFALEHAAQPIRSLQMTWKRLFGQAEFVVFS